MVLNHIAHLLVLCLWHCIKVQYFSNTLGAHRLHRQTHGRRTAHASTSLNTQPVKLYYDTSPAVPQKLTQAYQCQLLCFHGHGNQLARSDDAPQCWMAAGSFNNWADAVFTSSQNSFALVFVHLITGIFSKSSTDHMNVLDGIMNSVPSHISNQHKPSIISLLFLPPQIV